MLSIKKFIYNVIQNGNIEDQKIFLKLYPVLKLEYPIIKYWFNVLKKTMNNTNDQLFTDNIMQFLKIGLWCGYIKISTKYLKKFLNSSPDKNTQIEIARIVLNPHKISKKNILNFGSNLSSYDSLRIDMYNLSELKNDLNFGVSSNPNASSIKLDDIMPDEFVEVVNYYYSKIYNRITSHEIIHKIITNTNSSKKKMPNLALLFDFFKKISSMIPTEILVKTNKRKKRIQIIKKFIFIADKFLKTNNFEALFTVVSGLNNRTIQRLRDLWKPNKEHTKKFNELVNIISHENHYICYRELISEKTKYIPYLGLFFSNIDHCLQFDIVDERGKINLSTYQTLAQIINSFETVIPNADKKIIKKENAIINFINDYFVVDEECLYMISYNILKPMNTIRSSSDPITIRSSSEPITIRSSSEPKTVKRAKTNGFTITKESIKRVKKEPRDPQFSIKSRKLSITEQLGIDSKDKNNNESKNISLRLSGRVNSFRKRTFSLNIGINDETNDEIHVFN